MKKLVKIVIVLITFGVGVGCFAAARTGKKVAVKKTAQTDLQRALEASRLEAAEEKIQEERELRRAIAASEREEKAREREEQELKRAIAESAYREAPKKPARKAGGYLSPYARLLPAAKQDNAE